MLRSVCTKQLRVVSKCFSAPVQVRTLSTASNTKKYETGYGKEVDEIVNSARTPKHQQILLDAVKKFSDYEKFVVNPAKEVIPYLVAFPGAKNPLKPPPAHTEPIPVPTYPTYEELVANMSQK